MTDSNESELPSIDSEGVIQRIETAANKAYDNAVVDVENGVEVVIKNGIRTIKT
jgi:hypothetical protein